MGARTIGVIPVLHYITCRAELEAQAVLGIIDIAHDTRSAVRRKDPGTGGCIPSCRLGVTDFIQQLVSRTEQSSNGIALSIALQHAVTVGIVFVGDTVALTVGDAGYVAIGIVGVRSR